MRIALIEVAVGAHGSAEYAVHAGFIDGAREHHSLDVMALSNPGLHGLESPGIERRFVDIGARATEGLTPKTKLVRHLPNAFVESLKLVKSFQPDLIYSSQGRRDSMMAGALSKATGIPLVIHLHYPYGPWIGRVAAATVKGADHVIAVSEFVRESTLLRGLKDEQVTTIHVPIRGLRQPVADRATTRRNLGLDDDAVVVTAVGRHDPNKGFQSILEVLPSIKADAPKLRVLFCGTSLHTPGYDKYLEQRSHELGLGGMVTFLGHRPDVPDILAASDVFCLPTEMDAFPLVFSEAMRASLPVVAARSGGVPEIVSDGVTGLLSLPRDLGDLESNLRRLVLDNDLAKAMGRAGYEQLVEAFDPTETADRWMATLGTVVKG